MTGQYHNNVPVLFNIYNPSESQQTCTAHASSKRRRCTKPILQHKRDSAILALKYVLRSTTPSNLGSAETELQRIAALTICHVHQSQVDAVAKGWFQILSKAVLQGQERDEYEELRPTNSSNTINDDGLDVHNTFQQFAHPRDLILERLRSAREQAIQEAAAMHHSHTPLSVSQRASIHDSTPPQNMSAQPVQQRAPVQYPVTPRATPEQVPAQRPHASRPIPQNYRRTAELPAWAHDMHRRRARNAHIPAETASNAELLDDDDDASGKLQSKQPFEWDMLSFKITAFIVGLMLYTYFLVNSVKCVR